MTEEIDWGGWPNCIRLKNARCELVVSTDVGPRILHFGFINGENLFHVVPEQMGNTGGEQWRLYGGHRLWLAPEQIPDTFYPDNFPVKYSAHDRSILLSGEKESTTGIVKELEITLADNTDEVKLVHRMINAGNEPRELCAWGISMMARAGRAIVPQEPYGEGDEFLLPSRALALWQYTKMNDPRWIWGEKYIQAKQDPSRTSEQKIGVTNKQGWAAYCLQEDVLVKKFAYEFGANYADCGSNNEIYINGEFLEIETLGPVVTTAPGEKIEHTEHWLLRKAACDESEQSIDNNILPIVKSFAPTL